MKTVAFVPIKLNSQRLPHKNILPIADKPLCWYICNTLLSVPNIDEVYVYCSDDTVKQYVPDGVRYLKRPSYLDGDNIKGFDIYKEFISSIDSDIYVLAHTTSPFVKVSTLENALSMVINGKYDSAFSAQRVQTFSWFKGKPLNYDLNDVPRTQDIEPIWVETSAFYIFEKDIFIKHRRRIGFKPFVQEVFGVETIDIDEKSDYDFACKVANLGVYNE